MKTAISLPDALFDEAERVAARLGLSRSELYARAISRFVREHSGEELTAAIDKALGAKPAGLDPLLEALQQRSLGDDEGGFEDWVASARPGRTGPAGSQARASEPRGAKRRRG